MIDTNLAFIVAAAAAGAAAVVVVLRERNARTISGRAVGALIGIVLGTLLWWLTGAMVLWVVFLAMGGLIGFGIDRRLGGTSDRRA